MGRARKTQKKQSNASWGYHLLVNAGGCAPAPLRSKSIITRFAKDLVRKIDMVGYGEPQVVMFGSGNKKGYTLVQLIETSCITAHFVEETNDIYLDIFSCKPFAQKDALALFKETFGPCSITTHFLRRQSRHCTK